MTDRIAVMTGGVPASVAPAGPRVARYIVAGQTAAGPTSGPLVVRSLAEYSALFGSRTGGAPMWDAAEFFLGHGGSELVVQRAFGPSAVKATIGLDTNKIVATAKNPGAFYNAYTIAYTSASKTITIVKGTKTVTYAGTDAASLQSAASNDPDVTIAVSSLPASNVTATALSGGTDDYANVNWATVLGMIPAAVGPGAVATPGVTASVAALQAHATRRQAILSTGPTDSASTIASAQASAPTAPYAAGWGTVPDGAGGRKAIDPVSYVAAVRAVAQTVYGAGTSALHRPSQRIVGDDFQLLAEWSDADVTTLQNAGGALVRTLAGGVGVDNWSVPVGVGGNAALKGVQFRDVVNAVADAASIALDAFVGMGASGAVLRSAEAALHGVLQPYRAWLTDFGDSDPGYKVSASHGPSLSDNRIAATIRLRFVEGIDWVDLYVLAASADQSI